MPSFPLFMNLEGRRVLVVGAGNVAARKVEKLFPFKPRLDVVALAASDEVRAWAAVGRLSLELRGFELKDLDGAELVIVAVDDLALQETVFLECRRRGVPCNAVDSPAWCTFTFPALVVDGEATVAVSTGGQAPGVAAGVRAWLEGALPPGLGEVVARLSALRASERVRALPDASARATALAAYTRALLDAWARREPLPPPPEA